MDNIQTQKALDSSSEVNITVMGRRTGREYSTPVWFVREGNTVFLLPGGGSQSQWYKNAVSSERIKISSGRLSDDLSAKAVRDHSQIASIIDKFRNKYGSTYCSDPKRFNVALDLAIP